jgi:hypothetical protein
MWKPWPAASHLWIQRKTSGHGSVKTLTRKYYMEWVEADLLWIISTVWGPPQSPCTGFPQAATLRRSPAKPLKSLEIGLGFGYI